jgi:hypothetical protein
MNSNMIMEQYLIFRDLDYKQASLLMDETVQ